ncbi:MAG: alpha/beta fold hydrolase [Lishizhenia sp.]
MERQDKNIRLKDGRNLSYSEYGDLNGFPVIYFHGSQSSRLEMHYDLSFASTHKIRIITIDRPGHGNSDFNPNTTFLNFAEDVAELTEQLKLNTFSIAGMSAGAPFALAMCYRFPLKINKAAIISGFAPFNEENKKHLSKQVKTLLQLAEKLPFLLRILLKIQVKQIKKNPEKSTQKFLEIMSDADKEVLKNKQVIAVIQKMFTEAFKNGYNGVAHEISKLLVNDWEFNLQDNRVSTSIWQGEKDNNVPLNWASYLNNEIPNSTLKTFKEEGHLIIFNHAETIFKALVEK